MPSIRRSTHWVLRPSLLARLPSMVYCSCEYARTMAVRRYGHDRTVSSMKTTADLPEALVREAQDVARAEGTTLRTLVEDGLRVALERHRSGSRFRLPDASVDGNGLRQEVRNAGWDEVRSAIYGDRV